MNDKTIKKIGDTLAEFVLRVSKGTSGSNVKAEEIQVLPEAARVLLEYRNVFILAEEALQEDMKK